MIIFLNKTKVKEAEYDIKGITDRKDGDFVSVGGEGELRQHFLDMGLIPTGDVTMVKMAPMGRSGETSHSQL